MNEENTKNVFFLLLITIILSVFVIFTFSDILIKQIIVGILIFVTLFYLILKFKIIYQLDDYERGVIFRFGKISRVGGPGWTIVLPIIEKLVYITLRTETIDIPKQQIITKDNIKLDIDAVLYLSVNTDKQSVINSVVKVEDYRRASSLYVISLLRDILGEFDLTDVISNTEKINEELTESLKKFTVEWGLVVHSVEIKDLQIPQDIVDAMHKQKAAVQRKLAVYEEAESEKAKIDAVRQATEGLSENAITYYYIRALEKMSEGQSSKIIFPLELTKLLSSISNKLETNKLSINETEKQKLEKYLPLIKDFLKPKKKVKSKKK